MLFIHTHNLVLDRKKTSTLRLCDPGDALVRLPDKPKIKAAGPEACGAYAPTVAEAHPFSIRNFHGSVRWHEGQLLAVQRARCAKSLGWIRLTKLSWVRDPIVLAAESEPFIRSEGFATADEFLAIWHKMHGKYPHSPCWRLQFELVQVGGQRPSSGTPQNPGPQAADQSAPLFQKAGIP